MRPEVDYYNILNAFYELHGSGSSFTLWQNAGNVRNIHNVLIEDIDVDKNSVVTKPESDSFPFEIDEKKEIYFYCESPPCVFKSEKFHYKNEKITFPIPLEIYLLDKRINKRIEFDEFQKLPIVSMKLSNNINSKAKKLQLKLRNYSIGGMALSIPTSEGKYFYQGDSLIISAINNTVFESPINGQIAYVDNSYAYGEVKIGVKFDQELIASDLIELEKLF